MDFLKREDFSTSTWKRLTQHLEDRIAYLRQENDNPFHDQTKTTLMRGQIKALKEILALSKSSASHVDGQSNFPIEAPSNWQP